jgi:hypothetical protein
MSGRTIVPFELSHSGVTMRDTRNAQHFEAQASYRRDPAPALSQA